MVQRRRSWQTPRAMKESGNGPAVPFLQSLVDAMRKIADQTR
jgi:hypothetical protein